MAIFRIILWDSSCLVHNLELRYVLLLVDHIVRLLGEELRDIQGYLIKCAAGVRVVKVDVLHAGTERAVIYIFF